jgi:hypothetical protein
MEVRFANPLGGDNSDASDDDSDAPVLRDDPRLDLDDGGSNFGKADTGALQERSGGHGATSPHVDTHRALKLRTAMRAVSTVALHLRDIRTAQRISIAAPFSREEATITRQRIVEFGSFIVECIVLRSIGLQKQPM